MIKGRHPSHTYKGASTMIVTNTKAFTIQKIFYTIKQLRQIILKNQSYNLKQKPVFYANHARHSRQQVRAIIIVVMVSRYGIAPCIRDKLCNPSTESGT